ncbi:hypothetical protein ACIPUC_23975 [Streptomyces sp. LARHCF249]
MDMNVDVDVDRGMAGIPAPEVAHLRDVLDGLADNPALPDDVAVRLLAYRQGHRLAGWQGFTPSPDLCEAFVAAGQSEHLARVPSLPGSVAAKLALDPDADVRRALADNPRLAPELLGRLAADPDAGVRAAAAAAWTDPPEEALRALLTDPDPKVRVAACTRRPPRDLYGELLAGPTTRLRVIPHLELDRETAALLAADPDEDVRRRLAGHPELAPEVRDLLARDPNAVVRGGVFERADTPPELRAEIHAGLLAGSLRADEDPAAADEDDFHCYVALVASELTPYPWVTADPVPYADSPYLGMRRAAARSGALPDEQRRRMYEDEDATVRFFAFAGSPDPDPVVAEGLERRHVQGKFPGRPADRVRFPAETLRRFGADPSPRLRVLALRDPELPAELAERLAADEDAAVRREVAGSGHPRLPLPALLRLLGDAGRLVAAAAASSPMLPQAVMRQIVDRADAAGGPPLPDDDDFDDDSDCDCDCDCGAA